MKLLSIYKYEVTKQMKTKDICRKYNIENVYKFENFVRAHGYKARDGLTGMTIEDDLVPGIVGEYEKYKQRLIEEQENQKRLKEEQEIEDQLMKKACSEMLITSGFTFDGYRIKKYSGYISGDDCVVIPRNDFFDNNNVADNLCGALVKVRRQALKELKEAAYYLGCNAVIGVDFDYITMDPQHASAIRSDITVYEPYVICVTANGNAVVIEKEESILP